MIGMLMFCWHVRNAGRTGRRHKVAWSSYRKSKYGAEKVSIDGIKFVGVTDFLQVGGVENVDHGKDLLYN